MAEVTNSPTTYDYSTIGSFGSEATQSLSGETINKIRAAEEKATLNPIVEDLENWELESKKVAEIQTKINELIETTKPFDLFSSTNNAFEQISASTTGSSAIFDASDVGSLKEGTYQISISQLAQKDVWQSSVYTKVQSEAALTDSGTFTITGAGSTTVDIADVNGMTLQEIADQINTSAIATASVEQTGDDQYKLVIKSTEPGSNNALSFSGTATLVSDYNDVTDSDGDGNPDNHPQAAQNLQATIDGISYDVSSNSITIDGNLKVTATEVGSATLSIAKDDSSIVPKVQEMATKYNELVLLITEAVYGEDSPVADTSTLRDMLSGIKNMFFNEYGLNDENAVNLGLNFDKDGLLIVDTKVLGKALTDDYDKVKDFFLGAAEDKGFGTLMKEHLDNLNSYNGVFTKYQESMLERKTTLEENQEKEIERLDTKYSTMAAQFVQYASVIAQLEASFGGLKMMIAQSQSGN